MRKAWTSGWRLLKNMNGCLITMKQCWNVLPEQTIWKGRGSKNAQLSIENIFCVERLVVISQLRTDNIMEEKTNV